MTTKQISLNNHSSATATAISSAPGACSYLAVFAGGVGAGAGRTFGERLDEQNGSIIVQTVQIDTDQNEPRVADTWIDISFNAEHVHELKAGATRFGPEIVTAVESLGSLLNDTEVGKGARTEPVITQCAMAYHKERILRGLRQATDALIDKGSAARIQPILIGSNGGGTSRAVTILLPLLLAQPEFRSRLLAGLSDTLLAPPVVMVAYPISHARHSFTRRQETNILTNQMAWHREMDVLLRAGIVAYPICVGYSNAAGVILDESEDLKELLGTAAIDFMADRDYFESRWTDTISPADALGYLGPDVPELALPSVYEILKQYYGEDHFK